MNYNEKWKNENEQVLSGEEWYNIQAYRAINQGLIKIY